MAVAFNGAIRQEDEWFDEPDDLERVQRALDAIEAIEDPVDSAAVLLYRVARAQGFSEGNKRTAVLLAALLNSAAYSLESQQTPYAPAD